MMFLFFFFGFLVFYGASHGIEKTKEMKGGYTTGGRYSLESNTTHGMNNEC